MNTGVLSHQLRNRTHLGGYITNYLCLYQDIRLVCQRHCLQSSGWTDHQCVMGNICTRTLRNLWVGLVGTVPGCVEPVYMVSGGVSTPPSLKRFVDSTCFLSYGLFSHTHSHDHGIPFGIL